MSAGSEQHLLEYRLLGPLEVRSGGTQVPVQRGSQRAVLAALLLKANQVVSISELAEVLWGSAWPPSAQVTVQNYVKRLRVALGDADHSRISTQPRGYLIKVEPGELDVSRVVTLLATARAAADRGDWAAASAQAEEAVRLYRGEPLADLESELLTQRDVPRLAELRLAAAELRAECELRLDRYQGVISDLRQLVAVHPLRERFHALLMQALSMDGRQAEALAAYQQARQLLVAELGTEPGTELRELHQRLLAGDPAAASSQAGNSADDGRGRRVVPRQLPAPVHQFGGRDTELAGLTALLCQPGQAGPGTVLISAIAGTAGVGKTALAVHWGHQMAGRFPDGQLYVNLRGYDPGAPMTPADALAGFLRALGVGGQDIPPGLDERAAQYRSLLADRRMLVLLDNAAGVEQVRPLLPGSAASVALVTSRDALAGLVARDGAHRLDLDLLPADAAVGLLRALIGSRAGADPAATGALAEQCARLPLALRIAAELAVSRPASALADLVAELTDEQRRLDLLTAGGDPRTAVRAVFSWSFRQLDAQSARMFRLLSLHPGEGFEAHAAAALADIPVGHGRIVLDQLAAAHLVQPAGPAHLGMHDVLRAYARELAADESAADQQAAVTRLLRYYLDAACAAAALMFPFDAGRLPAPPPVATPSSATPPPMAGAAAALGWLDAELANLIAVGVHAAQHGWLELATCLAANLNRYLEGGGHYAGVVTLGSAISTAARAAGDLSAEADGLTALGNAELRLGSREQATEHLEQALCLFRQAENRPGEARVLGSLGAIEARLGHYDQAAQHLERALQLRRQTGDLVAQARMLTNLGVLEGQRGRHDRALAWLTEALGACRQTGDTSNEARALANIGVLEMERGRYAEAAKRLEQGIVICRAIGDRYAEGQSLAELGRAELLSGAWQPAGQHLDQALALCQQTGDRYGEVAALTSLADLALARGVLQQARGRYAEAVTLASKIGARSEQARAHDGLGRCYQAADDRGMARQHLQQALALYSQLSAPEADSVRAALAAVAALDSDEPDDGSPASRVPGRPATDTAHAADAPVTYRARIIAGSVPTADPQ